MTSFWLSKKALLEALKMTDGQPQTTMVVFKCDSEEKNGARYNVTNIEVCGKKKTIKQNFDKMVKANNFEL